jgi:hypothetical protein
MDGYQFSAAIFSSLVSLAWPAALVICVLLFRERLRTLLPFLRLKHKDTEVSFRLDQAEKESAQIDLQPTPELEPTPEEKSRFEKVVEHSPRAAIREKRAELEQVMRDSRTLLAGHYYFVPAFNVAHDINTHFAEARGH